MKAREITNRLIKAVKSQEFNFILVNYANVDTLAHTGDINATSKSVESVDIEIKRLWQEVAKVDGTLIITADHGNAEQMVQLKAIGDRETFHTLNPVPFILARNDLEQPGTTTAGQELLSKMLFSSHSLADIAPTILDLIGLDPTQTMDGKSLLKYLMRNNNGQYPGRN
jgi:2,3-bisphosphoglycerate-independent phosphoglycerate mutase